MNTLLTNSPEQAAEFLLQEQVIAFPTETVYGLGACIDSEKALSQIFTIKGRPADNPLIVHIANLKQLESLAQNLIPEAEALIKAFWPGPLTLVLESNKQISPLINAGLSTIAIRQPNHNLALKLIEIVGKPLAAPSANISGKPSGTKAKHVLADFQGLIPCVLEGETVYGLESTVVNCQKAGEVNILRLGSISFEALKKVIPNIQISAKNQEASPGTKYKHYSPQAQVKLIEQVELIENISTTNCKAFCAYIGFEQPKQSFSKVQIINSCEEYATYLFSFFRECDEIGLKTIYCQIPPAKGLGLALRDRLQKAALIK